MSSTESVDPELIEETKQQIRGLVNEIAELSQSEVSESEFYEGFLTRVVAALAAHGGVIWDVSSGRLQIACQMNLRESGLLESEEKQVAHGKLLRRALETGEPMIVQPHTEADDPEEGGNPTAFLMVLALLRADQEVQGIVEVFQRAGTPLETQRGYLRFLLQMSELAGDYLKTRSLRRYGHRQGLLNQIEQFTFAVHRNLDPRVTAYAIANEGRRLIECDRVSVALLRGTRCRVEAVSGQDLFDKRSNTIVLLENLATAVVRQGEPVWYTGDTSDMPPQVEEAVQAYVDESHSKTVAVIPLVRESEKDETQTHREPDHVVGALVIEQIEDARPRDGLHHRVDLAAALANVAEHNSVFLMPLWRAIGRSKWIIQARTLPKTISITAAALAIVLVLFIVPADYTLEGAGVLQPVVRQDVYAGVNGTVIDVLVQTGQQVAKGDRLAVLENTELGVRYEDYKKQRDEARLQILALRRRLDFTNPREDAQLQGQLAVLQQREKSLSSEIELLEVELKKLTIISPMDGVVVTWDVRNKLQQRPVELGQKLLTVAKTDAAWEVEVKMPEHRMGDVADERQRFKQAGGAEADLTVEYILATDPKRTYRGTIQKVGYIAEVQGEEGSTVDITVPIDDETRAELVERKTLRPGATVKARVHCGRRSIGYVWFRDLVNFVYSRILFRFF
jgi:multidrug efflux pump subunit AcrA (membrane-fusion protein)